jgi:hypothetical protein
VTVCEAGHYRLQCMHLNVISIFRPLHSTSCKQRGLRMLVCKCSARAVVDRTAASRLLDWLRMQRVAYGSTSFGPDGSVSAAVDYCAPVSTVLPSMQQSLNCTVLLSVAQA